MKRRPHVHRSGVPPEDARMRAYFAYHVDGAHKVPREGVRSDHFYACSWCRPKWNPTTDSEWEQFLMPALEPGQSPLALIAGRLG